MVYGPVVESVYEVYKGVKLDDRYIYRKKESKDWILQNDLYFNLNTSIEDDNVH